MSTPQQPDMREVAKHGSWLYWVAALSLVNLFLILFGSEWGFSISMGFTDILAFIGAESGGAVKAVTIGVSAVAIGVMALLGYFACRGAVWAFIAGLVVLALDTFLLLLGGFEAIISIAIHVWAIVSLFMGLRAAMALKSAPAPGDDGRAS